MTAGPDPDLRLDPGGQDRLTREHQLAIERPSGRFFAFRQRHNDATLPPKALAAGAWHCTTCFVQGICGVKVAFGNAVFHL